MDRQRPARCALCSRRTGREEVQMAWNPVRAAWPVLLCVLPLPAFADTLYKCVDAAGLAAIQMEPCARGHKQVWARDTAPEPPPTPEQVAAAQARAEEQARQRAEEQARWLEQEEARRKAAEAAVAKPEPAKEDVAAAAAPPPDPCDEAKAFAAQVRAKPWLGLDAAQMQRVYGWVAQQCAAPSTQ
jgi:hypothetical protein